MVHVLNKYAGTIPAFCMKTERPKIGAPPYLKSRRRRDRFNIFRHASENVDDMSDFRAWIDVEREITRQRLIELFSDHTGYSPSGAVVPSASSFVEERQVRGSIQVGWREKAHRERSTSRCARDERSP